jgi:hypothetical protein
LVKTSCLKPSATSPSGADVAAAKGRVIGVREQAEHWKCGSLLGPYSDYAWVSSSKNSILPTAPTRECWVQNIQKSPKTSRDTIAVIAVPFSCSCRSFIYVAAAIGFFFSLRPFGSLHRPSICPSHLRLRSPPIHLSFSNDGDPIPGIVENTAVDRFEIGRTYISCT